MIDMIFRRCRKPKFKSIKVIQDVLINVINRPMAFISDQKIKEVRREGAILLLNQVQHRRISHHVDASIKNELALTFLGPDRGVR